MKIVILDSYTANPGDMDFSGLAALGELVCYDRTPAELAVQRAAGAEIVLTNKVLLGAAELEQLPELKYIGVMATGYNVVDIEAARAKGVVVTNVPAYSTNAVAQLVFALLLKQCHHVADHSAAVHQGRWAASEDFCFWDSPLLELDGLTMGIVGYGQIGQAVARIAAAFGMTVIVYTRTQRDADVNYVSLDELFAQSDVVSLNCPLTPDTAELVNAKRLSTMKPSAILINTGRGGLINEADLAAALNDDVIAAAAVDVLSTEPPAGDNPLLTAKNCTITPHIAWATQAARKRLIATLTANIQAFQNGQPINVVS